MYVGIITLLIFSACTKTEVAPYDREPLNKILEYKITNSKQDLLGAIDNQTNNITVYIPYYLGIDFLTPTISLDKGAILIDANGNEINLDGGVDPIALGDTVTYNVKGTDNKVRTYTVIQKFLPLNEVLKASYMATMEPTAITKNATDRFNIYGNFGSTSTSAKYIFTDKVSGKSYDNFVKTISLQPSASYYTVTAQLEPESLAGSYRVEIQHQGRKTQLPDMDIKYSLPFPTFFGTTTSSYAVGDTITFTPSTFGILGGEGVYLELDRVYAIFTPAVEFPAGFPSELINKQIEFKVAEQTRRHVKVIVPSELPVGLYKNTNSNNLNFFFDYASHTNYEKGIRTGVAGNTFEIKAKTN